MFGIPAPVLAVQAFGNLRAIKTLFRRSLPVASVLVLLSQAAPPAAKYYEHSTAGRPAYAGMTNRGTIVRA